MSYFSPSIAEERSGAIRAASQAWQKEGLIGQKARRAIEGRFVPGWRSNGLVLSAVFLVLTLLGLAAFYALCELFHWPRGVVPGVVALATAELLIERGRLFGTGVESALWIGGLICLITALPSSGKPEAWLIFAVAFALAGLRVRNPLFGAGAAILVIAYVAVKVEREAWPAAVAGAIIAVASAIALTREWKRSSTELLFDALVLTAPLAGYVAAELHRNDAMLALLYLVVTGVLAIIGARVRDRVLLIGAAIAFGVAAFDLHKLLPMPVEAKLIAAGGLLIATAWLLSRFVGARVRGFVATPSEITPYDEAIQIAGVINVAQPAHSAPSSPQVEPGGGSFGGAGASGEF